MTPLFSHKPSPAGRRALVIGASMAGLLAARVLADHFDEVLVVERDELPALAAARKGTPHASHTHGLLARGLQIIESLFPGFTSALQTQGAELGDTGTGVPFVAGGRRFASRPSGIMALAASRLAIEAEIRRRVRALANVSIRCGVDVCALLCDPEGSRIEGVRARPLDDGGARPEELRADLVIDASGRGSRLPSWLLELGYGEPESEIVDVGIAYVTAYFERKNGDLAAGQLGMVGSATPELPRPGVVLAQEPLDGGSPRWVVSVGGYRGDHPEPTLEGLRERARAIGCDELVRVTRGEPMSAVTSYRFAHSQRRHYERLRRWPARLLVIGDAMASFNPVYGQGMTVAACEALAVHDFISAARAWTTSAAARQYLSECARIVDVPWQIAVGADLAMPMVPGPRPLAVRVINAYMARVLRAAEHDAEVATTFVEVAHMLRMPAHLMTPRMMWRVWRAQHARAASVDETVAGARA